MAAVMQCPPEGQAEPFKQQLALFGGSDRLPRRPWCTDDLRDGLRIRNLAQALSKPYIQLNPHHLRVWSIYDVDRPGGGLAWEDANLPPPNFATINRQNGHAHLVWGLSAPVLLHGDGLHQKPIRYLAGIESLMRERLQADSGYSGLITKNPAHPLWKVLKGPSRYYQLGDLAEWLPGLERHIPRRGIGWEYGLGRNCILFDWLRQWAYKDIRKYWHNRGDQGRELWTDILMERAMARNADFSTPLHPSEVKHIARSVARYTWARFNPAEFSAWQSARGAKGGQASGEARRVGSITEAQPWKTEGISRATWYRRKLFVPRS